MTNGSLMKVESIAEFCNTFDLNYAIIGLEKQFLVFLRVAVLDRFYCIVVIQKICLFETILSSIQNTCLNLIDKKHAWIQRVGERGSGPP